MYYLILKPDFEGGGRMNSPNVHSLFMIEMGMSDKI